MPKLTSSSARPTVRLFVLGAAVWSCGPAEHPEEPRASASASASSKPETPPPANPEPHLADLRQLTFGGENAEAYWAWSGRELILQARTQEMGCDRIFRMSAFDAKPSLVPVSSGKGATTCSYFLPGDQDVIYASTHLGGDACPPKPDHKNGYVWPLYETYDIFRAKADGSGVVRLTDTPGYDAEGTVCKKDGSIVFTSVRSGDLELYRMDADGKNVKQLTHSPGYDGGAFFNEDCTKIVWRASRPKGKALEEYKALLEQHLVRPTKLELYVANADGSEPVQVTYLDAASFAPFFAPGSKRILFSSNVGDPKGREFDIWAVNTDGTQLERITTAPGFDGFPIFSPDGKYLAFSSNRNNPPDSHDTNVFVARWVDATVKSERAAADRTAGDVAWLADLAREGRGVGTKGLDEAGAYLEKRYRELGLEPVLKDGAYRQHFDVTTKLEGKAKLGIGSDVLAGTQPLAFSKTTAGPVTGKLVFAGYGIQTEGWDDYKGLDVKDKIVLVRRFTPDDPKLSSVTAQRKHGDLSRKAWLAREKGAKAIIVVDAPPKGKGKDAAEEAKPPSLDADVPSNEGIVAVIGKRAELAPVIDKLARGATVEASIEVSLTPETRPAFNVVAKLPAKVSAEKKKPGVIVVGAHYDHLGMGGRGSLAPGETKVHPGADDNASGTASILEVARALSQPGVELARDVIFVSFSGEERGILGSTYFTKNPPPGVAPKDVAAMINLDMVGRLHDNKLEVEGAATGVELAPIVKDACGRVRLECNVGPGSGYGPSDHAAFYGAGVPVLFLFTGLHADYHKPSDTSDKINAAGMARAAALTEDLVRTLAARDGAITYVAVADKPAHGDPRSFGASLGTIPDYAASGEGKGVVLAGVRPGGGADKAGIKAGDVLVRIGNHDITSVEDLMYVLNESKPGQKAKAIVIRDGKRVTLPVVFQGAKPH